MTQADDTPRFSIRAGLRSDHIAPAAQQFWTAFSGKLGMILGPEEKALTLLRKAIDPSHAIAAVDDGGDLLGVVGYKTAESSFVGGTIGDVAAVYGMAGALWRLPLLAVLERRHEPGVLSLDGIFVDAGARGRGVGSALLQAVTDEARKRGLSTIRLDVIDSNPRARALYERNGYREVRSGSTGPLRPILGFRRYAQMEKTVSAAADAGQLSA